jgi:hypothetical protein
MKYKLQNTENPAKEMVEYLESKGIDKKESKDMALTIFWMFIQCHGEQLEKAIETLGGPDIDFEW